MAAKNRDKLSTFIIYLSRLILDLHGPFIVIGV